MRTRGYVLTETAVVIVIAVLLLAFAITAGAFYLRASNRQAAQARETSQLAAVAAAASDYAVQNASTFTATAPTLVPIATLKAAGNLDANASAVSVLGQAYVVAAMLPAAGAPQPQVLVYESGTPDAAKAARANVNTATADLMAFDQAVAAQTSSQGWNAGTILSGTQLAVGTGNAWTEDLTAMLGSPIANNTPAVLIGFPDLAHGPRPPGNQNKKYVGCNVVHPTVSVAPPTCPAGTDQVATWPFCGTINSAITPQYAVYPSKVGDVVVGFTRTKTAFYSVCTVDEPFGPCPGYKDVRTDGLITVNGAVFSDANCQTDNVGTYKTGQSATANCNRPPVSSGATSNICTITTVNPVIGAQGANALDVLCCTPAN